MNKSLWIALPPIGATVSAFLALAVIWLAGGLNLFGKAAFVTSFLLAFGALFELSGHKLGRMSLWYDVRRTPCQKASLIAPFVVAALVYGILFELAYTNAPPSARVPGTLLVVGYVVVSVAFVLFLRAQSRFAREHRTSDQEAHE